MDENQLFPENDRDDDKDDNSDGEVQDLEFDFELINDVAWATKYLEEFE